MVVGTYVLLACLIVMLVITRNLYEIVTPGSARGADGYVHMVIAKEIRNNSHWIPETISDSVFRWKFSYPYFLHLILSFIPQRHYESVDRLFPTAMDLLYVGLLAILIPLDLISLSEFTLLLSLFIFTPQFIQSSSGKGISARKPGIILATLSFLSFVLWNTEGLVVVFLASAVLAGLTHLTSWFGTQAIVLIYMSLAFFYPAAAAIVLLSFLFSVVASLGEYIHIFKTHVRFSHDFAVRKQFVFLYDGFKSVDTVRRFLRARSISDVQAAVYESVLLKSLFNNPYAIGAIVVLVWSYYTSTPIDTVPTEMVVWFGSGLLIYLLTTFYGLRFLGQPGRYLNYVFIPGALIVIRGSSILPIGEPIVFAVLILMGLGMLFGQALAYKRLDSSPEEQQAFDDAISHLRSCDTERVLTQPRHIGAEIAWKAQNTTVSDDFCDFWGSNESVNKIKNIFTDDPFITSDIEKIKKYVDPTKVIFKRQTNIPEGCLCEPSTESEFENDHYAIYDFDSLCGESD